MRRRTRPRDSPFAFTKEAAMQKPARVAIAGALVAAILTLPGLGTGTLWDNSETAYGEVAREILLAHDAVVMHLNASPWFVQPPLYFWIAALLGKLLGTTAFALRLPSALATIAMAAITGYTVTRAAGERTGLYATVILSTGLMQAIVGRLAIMDALLDLCVTLALFWWWRGLQSGAARYFLFGCAAVAFGFLAKGPVAPVVAALVIIPFYVWERRAGRPVFAPSPAAWAAGAGIFALIALPWLLLLVQRTGAAAVVQLIGHYTFGRYTGTIENQAGPFWYYVPVLILGFFPWAAFLPAALAYGVNQMRGRSVDDGHRSLTALALCWSVVPFVFFSFARTKLPNYIALELPGVAVLVALYFDSIVRRYRRRSLMISAATIPATIVLLGVAIALFSKQNRLTAGVHDLAGDLLAVGIVIFVGSVVTTLLFLSERTAQRAPVVLAGSALLGTLVLALVALPQAEQFKPIPRLSAIVNRQVRAGDVVAIQGVPGGNALTFYTRPPVVTLAAAGDPRPLHEALPQNVICRATRAFVVTSKRRPPFDPSYGRNRRLLAVDDNDALYLYEGPRCSR